MNVFEMVMALGVVGAVAAGAVSLISAGPSPEALSRWDPQFASAVTELRPSMVKPCVGREAVSLCHRVYGYEFENRGDDIAVRTVDPVTNMTQPVVEVRRDHVIDAPGGDVFETKRELYAWLLQDEMDEARRRTIRRVLHHSL